MTISFLTAGPERVASSRIRVHCLLPALRRMGVRPILGFDPAADALFVQKRVTAEVLDAVSRFRRQGKLVIYDCDDAGAALEFWAPSRLLARMLAAADLVTTNTLGFRRHLRGLGASRVEIVPDTIDYYLASPIEAGIGHSPRLRLLWFGHRQNLPLLQRHLPVLTSIAQIRIVVCTNPRVPPTTGRLSRLAYVPLQPEAIRAFGHQAISFVRWTVEAFPPLLRSCQLSFLPHDGPPADRAKSENRMITSIAWGTPAIASRTPAYRAAAGRFGVPECLFARSAEIPQLVASLRSTGARRSYLAKAQPRIWRDHAPEVVARKLQECIMRKLGRAEGGFGADRHPPPCP